MTAAVVLPAAAILHPPMPDGLIAIAVLTRLCGTIGKWWRAGCGECKFQIRRTLLGCHGKSALALTISATAEEAFLVPGNW